MSVLVRRDQQMSTMAKLAIVMGMEKVKIDERYLLDPVEWAIDQLAIPEETLRWSSNPGYENHQWDGTPDPMCVMADAIASGRDCGVEGATGTQKTHMAAILMLWMLHCFESSMVITSAPKQDQLRLNLWANVSKLWPRFQEIRPNAQRLKLQVRMDPPEDEWTAVAFPVGVGASEESATKAQGFHAEHMLIITEETPGIHHATMTAFINTCTAEHNMVLALGNPDDTEDELHKHCVRKDTIHVRASAVDHPNVVCKDSSIVPGAATQKSIDKKRSDLGEDSPMYLSRVHGICPKQSTDALIKLEWIREAIQKSDKAHPAYKKLIDGSGAMGVDVANSPAGDEGVIARGIGAVLQELIAGPCPDANELGRQVKVLAKVHGIIPRHIGVDSVGVGAGTVNELKRLKMNVQSLGGGNREVFMEGEEHFADFRSQMWWIMREDLRHGRVALLDDNKLRGDLVAPKVYYHGGKIKVESKEDLMKRLGRSPDRGDAVVYWNWARQFLAGVSGRSSNIAL